MENKVGIEGLVDGSKPRLSDQTCCKFDIAQVLVECLALAKENHGGILVCLVYQVDCLKRVGNFFLFT